jgi:streptogramin lyase
MKLRALLLIVVLALLVPQAASAAPGEVTTYPLPAGAVPEGIAAGADGNLWFAEHGANAIGRITPAGQVTEFPLPTANAQPMQIAAGADGNMWFTEWRSGNVGRIAPDGTITEFPICPEYCRPSHITAGPEGDVWVVLSETGQVARVTPDGTVTKFHEVLSFPGGIAAGSDGNLWVADSSWVREEPGPGYILRLTPTGESTSFAVPTLVENFRPMAIAAAPDGVLWFAGGGRNLGRIETDGTITELPFRVSGEAHSMVVGPEGDIWVAKDGPSAADGSIDRVTPDGYLTSYYVPYGSRGVTVGPEGDIWFTEGTEGAIGRIAPGAAGLEIGAESSPVRGRWARLPIACNGGAAGGRCAGTVVLRVSFHLGSGKHVELRRVPVGSARYSVAEGGTAVVHVRLNRKRLKRFQREDEVRTVAIARASAGVGERHRFLLTLR